MVIKDLGERREGWISWVQRIITVVKLFLYCSLVVKYIIPHSLKPTDYTIPGVNIIVNIYGLWVIMVHQCSFIDYNKCTTLCYVDSRRICVLWRYGVFVNQLPIFSAHFCFKSKSVLKYKIHLRNIILDAVWVTDTHWSERIGPTVFENIRQDRYRDINE